MAALDRPSAISDSTVALTGREPVERVAVGGQRASSCVTTSGSRAVPPSPTRRTRVDEVAHVGNPVLEQVARSPAVLSPSPEISSVA